MTLALAAGLVLVGAGVIVAGVSLRKVHQCDVDGPAEQIGPCVYPFVLGIAVAIIGGFVVMGDLIGRLL